MFKKRLLMSLMSVSLIFTGALGVSASEIERQKINKPEDVPVEATYPNSRVEIKPGDILITNNTSSKGLTGHAAIVIDTENVVEILGPGFHPQKNPIKRFFGKNVSKKYGTKVVRYNRTKIRNQAADWAEWYVKKYDDVEYAISDLYNYKYKTYCSKIVWNAYYFGAGVRLNTSTTYVPGPGGTSPIELEISAPYDLEDSSDVTTVLTQGNF
ncbi:YiiX/YebB-like N1pC/P60 family cysteine hydrolase [Brevibacillus halotolerans]|uniref:YiiX/YebB-like N1pC/P60 family cysteine hydrolase n=1 Tax=Brevibacillus TaxID=55080 RepID=UPI0003002671|nr:MULTISPECIES: YiiX/YebB-like N1pC/P60 family cysteine hydrolase [Brevibacillus]MCR8996519.1 YiiX/YebB-like N1pC/P60 family cysteine hydrolase [Brevibacillus laterosporus]WPS87377.1 YiiX/YebB-like N1pC/P60 family cysteine hydrolase [Brevibacillus halotolerans]